MSTPPKIVTNLPEILASGSEANYIKTSIKVYDEVTKKEHEFKFNWKYTDGVSSIKQYIAGETGYAEESLNLLGKGYFPDKDSGTLEYSIFVTIIPKTPAAQLPKDDVESPDPAAVPQNLLEPTEQLAAFPKSKDNKNSRTALAWDLAQKHSEDASATNDVLVKAIYKGSFAESGFFKCSAYYKIAAGDSLVCKKNTKAEVKEKPNTALVEPKPSTHTPVEAGKFAEHSQKDKNSRTHKICEALSSSPKMS